MLALCGGGTSFSLELDFNNWISTEFKLYINIKGIVGGVKMTLGCPTTVPKGHHIPRILANLPKSFPGEKEI